MGALRPKHCNGTYRGHGILLRDCNARGFDAGERRADLRQWWGGGRTPFLMKKWSGVGNNLPNNCRNGHTLSVSQVSL